jgi:Kef-type K+ transport system membrane component KefB
MKKKNGPGNDPVHPHSVLIIDSALCELPNGETLESRLKMDILLLMGSMLITGYLAGGLAARLGFPRITGYMVAGILMNPSILPFIHRNTVDTLNFITPVVLGVISYMIGGGLHLDAIRKLGKAILSITIFQGLTPFLLSVCLIAGLGPCVLQIPGDGLIATFIPMALILGAIAASSAPAAIVAIIHECRAKGPVTTTCLAVLALTDAFTVIAFAIVMGIGRALVDGHWATGAADMLVAPFLHILGSIAAGLAFGYVLLKGLIKLRTTLGLLASVSAGILILTGMTQAWGLSPILANMAAGFVVVNGSGRDEMITVLERIEDVLFILFFVLNGMYIDIVACKAAGALMVLIMAGRKIGKYTGARIGAALVGTTESLQKLPGLLLLPKAGLTLGLAFLARQAFPSFGPLLFNALLASTIINMLLTPPLAKYALLKSGEAGRRDSPA